MSTNVIRADGLVKSFKDGSERSFDAVAGIGLEVGPREIIGLFGPNGAGKSTLIDMVLGLSCLSHGARRTASANRLSPSVGPARRAA